MLQHVEKQLDKALADIDKLKDKVRKMEKITEVVIALLMIVNGEIQEHRMKSMSECLKGKRVASEL